MIDIGKKIEITGDERDKILEHIYKILDIAYILYNRAELYEKQPFNGFYVEADYFEMYAGLSLIKTSKGMDFVFPICVKILNAHIQEDCIDYNCSLRLEEVNEETFYKMLKTGVRLFIEKRGDELKKHAEVLHRQGLI